MKRGRHDSPQVSPRDEPDTFIERVSQFDPATNDGPGDESVVTYIELGYEFVQSWWIVLIFDTRSDAEPDGEWTNHLKTASIYWNDLIGLRQVNATRPNRLM